MHNSTHFKSIVMIAIGIAIIGLQLASTPVRAASDSIVYADLLNGWVDWSWDTTRNLNNSTPVHSGTASIAATYTAAWGGLYLHNNQDTSGNAQPTFYIDDITILGTNTPPPPLALTVDANANRHAISPYIYGMSFAPEALASELKITVDRWGGNATTRYNWQNDTQNRAMDWYFENIPNTNPNPGWLPNGSITDLFIEQDRRTGSKTLLTIPTIGWTPKSRAIACGFSVTKYGAQQSVDPWQTDCGNGVHTNGTNVTGNDPLDTSIAITETFVQGWMQHLINNYGNAANGGVQFYALDNEPMLWNSSHRDVHPNATTYDEVYDKGVQYAAAIKTTDANAKIFGPTLWGWDAYFYSALDLTSGNSDRTAHSGTAFLDWYLQQFRAYEQSYGTRLLDYLDIHFYPQGNGVFSTNAGNANTQALRLRSTRALWDSPYADESWIAQTAEGPYVRLIPRMHDWVNNNYPGTKIALTEYNWGALGDLNGALAQADILGILGRENVDLAALWDPPTSTQPGAFAFRMYRNYDGTGKMFGDTSGRATSTDQDQLAIYAAQRTSDSALTIIVINKTTNALTAPMTISNFTSGVAQVYRYSNSNLNAITHLNDQAIVAGNFTSTFPASSITLFVLMPNATAPFSYLFLPFIKR